MGLARLFAIRKRWFDAEPHYARIVETFADTSIAPEAIYWRGISIYRRTNDHHDLEATAEELFRRFPGSLWDIKASVWRT